MAALKVLLVAAVASVLWVGASCQSPLLRQLAPQLGQLLDCPPENPFCPKWVPCNYTETQGPTCQDCKTRVICTPVGGLLRPCVWPFRRHCVDGECQAHPSEECAPSPPPEPETTTETETTTEAETEPTTEAVTEANEQN